MLKGILMVLSKSKRAEQFVAGHGFTKRITDRFVAGEKLEDALEAISQLNDRGFEASLNYLGEHVNSEAIAEQATEEYLNALDEISKRKLRSHVSVKLTQLGIDLGEDLCYRLTEKIVARAQEYGNFIRIDMENSKYTEITLAIHWKLREKFHNVGVAIQAYLYKSEQDMGKMVEKGGKMRLCKGAYNEPKEMAFQEKKEVDKNYIKLAEMMLSRRAVEKGARTALATHDEKIIKHVIEHAEEQGLQKKDYEFQLLFGIKRDLQESLLKRGLTTRVYVPYGKAWYPYFMRRLAERPANMTFFLKNLFKT